MSNQEAIIKTIARSNNTWITRVVRQLIKRNPNGLSEVTLERLIDCCHPRLVERIDYINNRINLREQLAAEIQRYQENGQVSLLIDSTDCDWTRVTYTHTMAALTRQVERYMATLREDAEGPTSCIIISPSAAQEHEPTSRDLVLEAHEDGHPHCIHN